MKLLRVILCVACSFVAGCAAHWIFTVHQFERERGELESHYQSAFPKGSDFEKIASGEAGDFHWSFSAEDHRFVSWVPPSGWPRLAIYVEVDAQKKVQSVSVNALTIQ